MRDIIIHIISMRNGIKSTDLCLAVMEKINPQGFDFGLYLDTMKELIESKEIKVLEYSDPDDALRNKYGKLYYMLKSMYFSKATTFMNLRGEEQHNARTSENTLVRKS